MTMNLSRGSSTVISFRLCSRAPLMIMDFISVSRGLWSWLIGKRIDLILFSTAYLNDCEDETRGKRNETTGAVSILVASDGSFGA